MVKINWKTDMADDIDQIINLMEDEYGLVLKEVTDRWLLRKKLESLLTIDEQIDKAYDRGYNDAIENS